MREGGPPAAGGSVRATVLPRVAYSRARQDCRSDRTRQRLAARPPSDADEPSGRPSERERNEPARPALDGLSLRSGLGAEGADKTDAPVSFDDFFGSQEKGAGAEKGGEPGNDDLDQFHSWLQNLKP